MMIFAEKYPNCEETMLKMSIYNSVSLNSYVYVRKCYKVVGTFNKEKVLEVGSFSKYCKNYRELLLTPSEGDCPSFLFIRQRRSSSLIIPGLLFFIE